jgi:D-amino-acid dehydrogenase
VPILLPESRAALTPLDGRLRLTGSVELCGIDLTIRGDRVEAMRRRAASVLRDARDREPTAVWAGLRPCTPDGLPVIGRPERAPGLVVATGHATKGVALAPVTAMLVAELVTGEPPGHDLAPFSPDRFRPLLRRR